MNYYNEIDPYCCEWLKNLIAKGLIGGGYVDSRSIKDVQPEDLIGFKQCHFFAGIAGWSYALQLAGWPDDREVWTGSCPCQPYSVAGKRAGNADERNLWPEMFRLIAARRPERVFGEQVEGAVKHGWLDGVFANLESQDYSTGAAVLGAHSVGAPHIRQRLFWMADSEHAKRRTERQEYSDAHGRYGFRGSGQLGGLADMRRDGLERRQVESTRKERAAVERSSGTGGLEYTESVRWFEQRPESSGRRAIGGCGWSDFDIVHCINGKARRIESGTFPLAHGVPARVGKLRAYGNAIVPQTAAEFIKASL